MAETQKTEINHVPLSLLRHIAEESPEESTNRSILLSW